MLTYITILPQAQDAELETQCRFSYCPNCQPNQSPVGNRGKPDIAVRNGGLVCDDCLKYH